MAYVFGPPCIGLVRAARLRLRL